MRRVCTAQMNSPQFAAISSVDAPRYESVRREENATRTSPTFRTARTITATNNADHTTRCASSSSAGTSLSHFQ